MAKTMTKVSAKTAASNEKSSAKKAAKKAPVKTPLKAAAKKSAGEKPAPSKMSARTGAAKAAVKTAKKTVKDAISSVVGAVARKKHAPVPAREPEPQAPAAPPRKHKVATAFASALGAWAEDEAAALARSGAEYETLRRKGLREGVSLEEVGSKKFEIRAGAAKAPEAQPAATEHDHPPLAFPMTRELEDLYDETRLTVLVRDPEWVFAYWDIDTATRERLGIPRGRHSRRLAIRWYDVTEVDRFDGANAHRTMDVEVSDAARSWYQKMPEANRCWLADLGIVDEQGGFTAICRSNLARMPRMRMAPGPEEGGPEEVWMHVEHGPAAPFGKVPRKRVLRRGEQGATPQAPGRPVQPSRAVEFLGATETRVKEAAPKKAPAPPLAVPSQLFPGASEQLMRGASEGFLGGASERLVKPRK